MPLRQVAGIPNLHPVGEDDHLNEAAAGVITVRDSIDDGLAHHELGNLRSDRRRGAAPGDADPALDPFKDKSKGALDHLEGRADEGSLVPDRFRLLAAVEPKTLDLDAGQEPVRRSTE